MSPAVKTILDRVASWPDEDQQELSELAREIEARRVGVYRLSDEERAAIDSARRSPLAADDDVETFWSAAAFHEAALPRAGARRHRRY